MANIWSSRDITIVFDATLVVPPNLVIPVILPFWHLVHVLNPPPACFQTTKPHILLRNSMLVLWNFPELHLFTLGLYENKKQTDTESFYKQTWK